MTHSVALPTLYTWEISSNSSIVDACPEVFSSGVGPGLSDATRIGSRFAGTDLNGVAHGAGEAGAEMPMNGRAMLEKNDDSLFGAGVSCETNRASCCSSC